MSVNLGKQTNKLGQSSGNCNMLDMIGSMDEDPKQRPMSVQSPCILSESANRHSQLLDMIEEKESDKDLSFQRPNPGLGEIAEGEGEEDSDSDEEISFGGVKQERFS